MIYTGELARSLDFAQFEQSVGIALGYFAQATMGTATWAAGLGCGPTTPASLSVILAPGVMGSLTVVEQNEFGTVLPPDTTDPLVKMGVNIATTTQTFVAPSTSGFSQNFLIQAQMQETDTGSTVLNYYNAANPSSPFTGPGGSGTAQNTQRIQRVVFEVKAGTPASTGTQTTPGADSGWAPMYVVTLANGQTTITSGSIAKAAGAPFIPYTLPAIGALVNLFATVNNVLSSRALATTYTNTTGKPMFVSVVVGAGGLSTIATLTINSIVVGQAAFNQAVGSGTDTLQFVLSGIVPPGQTYTVSSVGTVTLVNWTETY